MDLDAISRLTDRQRDCLRLVMRHMQSKDIGRELGISPATVDNHFRTAIQTLGVTTRLEAARLLHEHETGWTSQRLTSQSPAIAFIPETNTMAPSNNEGDGRGGSMPANAVREEQTPFQTGFTSTFPLPFPTNGKRQNDLRIFQRVGWTFAIIIGLALATGILLSGLGALSTLFLALRR
jgi:DNA-binding CsgD family transcriptional regulator